MKNIIIMGVQGSGKGTQAELLCETLNLKHINTGEIFRQQLKQRTELGQEAQVYINKGELVPDELVFRIVEGELKSAENGFLLDGFPRTVAQAEFLLAQYTINDVFYLNLDDETAKTRISSRRVCKVCGANYNLITQPPKVDGVCDICGGEVIQRSDDTEAAIAKRIEKFHEETDVLTSYFEQLGILHCIQADQPIADVQAEILSFLK
jgi:adenylate kinase